MGKNNVWRPRRQAVPFQDRQRIGGVGLKIHPDLRYANLYYWLVGDDVIFKGWNGFPLPRELRSLTLV